LPNAALRFTPPARAQAPQGGLLNALLPMRRLRQQPPEGREGEPQAGARVCARAGPGRRPVAVTTGATDGTWTEIKERRMSEPDAAARDRRRSGEEVTRS